MWIEVGVCVGLELVQQEYCCNGDLYVVGDWYLGFVLVVQLLESIEFEYDCDVGCDYCQCV